MNEIKMDMFLVVGLVLSVAVICNAQGPPTAVGNCANRFPKPGCNLQMTSLCSEACGWSDERETYDCNNGAFSCERPCFLKKCPADEALVDCTDLPGDCIRVMFSKCSRNCGIGAVYESYLCNGGPRTCKKKCCCQSCPPTGSGIKPPILCRDIPTTPHMCPHIEPVAP